MDILVIGLGSMGKRRIRLLQRLRQSDRIIAVDQREDRRKEARDLYQCQTYLNIEDALNDHPNCFCAFICTSPLSHSNLIRTVLNYNLHVFTEINLVSDGYGTNMELARQKGKVLFLSSTSFYREESRLLQKQLKGKNNLNYIYHIGQYLPDWHPWEKYTDFFLSDKRTNGCREIMAIEFPWLIDIFGEIEKFKVVANNISKLNIQYNDNYMIQFEHRNCNKGALIIDVVSPKAVRNLEIYGENVYYSWNGTPESLEYYCEEEKKIKPLSLYDSVEHMDGYSSFVVENAYQNEIQAFFDAVEKNIYPPYGFENDLEILNLIDRIEEACCE